MDRKSYGIDVTSAIRYTDEGETALRGDFYRPVDRGPHPVVVAVHGGGWDQGSRSSYRDWGTYLAERGFALFATDRRHFKPNEPAFPGVIDDVQAAVRYVRSHAAELHIDPQRIAMMGDSSGGYIAALAGLVGDMAMGQRAADDVVSEELHSRPFAQMLGQANFAVHTMILPHAQHYWAADPLHGEPGPASLLAPRLVRFLEQCL